VEIYWGQTYQVYVTPTSADSACVAAISSDSRFWLDDAICGLPDLARRLNSAKIMTGDRGAITASRKFKAVYGNCVALVADASGSVDAITAEGLSLAFRQPLR
jgi:flavin-dependent dehydrogenase